MVCVSRATRFAVRCPTEGRRLTRRLTRGRSQVTFDTLNQPNLDYDVSVSVRVGTTRVFFTVDDSGAITTTTRLGGEWRRDGSARSGDVGSWCRRHCDRI